MKVIPMLQYNERPSEGKYHNDHVDADDLAILTLTRKFGLTRSTARALAHAAGLGSDDDRRATSGGRAA
jgi:hypothetical protein